MTTLVATDGKHSVSIFENGENGKYGYIAMANLRSFAYENPLGEPVYDDEYWFGIGTYKTLKSAITWSRKKMAKFGITLQ